MNTALTSPVGLSSDLQHDRALVCSISQSQNHSLAVRLRFYHVIDGLLWPAPVQQSKQGGLRQRCAIAVRHRAERADLAALRILAIYILAFPPHTCIKVSL